MTWYLQPLMFLVGVATDVVWTIYVQSLADRKRLKSACFSVGTGVMSILWVEGLITEPVSMAFWLGGLFVGTYYSSSIENFFKGFGNVARKR